jgi:hypothetical protein
VIDEIDAALDMTSAVVGALPAGRLAEPSLCPGWRMRDELNHLVGGMHIFAAQLAGGAAAREHDDDWLGDDPFAAFAAAAELDRAAWHRPGALDGAVRLSFGTLPAPMAARVHLTEVLPGGPRRRAALRGAARHDARHGLHAVSPAGHVRPGANPAGRRPRAPPPARVSGPRALTNSADR